MTARDPPATIIFCSFRLSQTVTRRHARCLESRQLMRVPKSKGGSLDHYQREVDGRKSRHQICVHAVYPDHAGAASSILIRCVTQNPNKNPPGNAWWTRVSTWRHAETFGRSASPAIFMEKNRADQTSQSSTVKPATRSNSPVLCVTSVS